MAFFKQTAASSCVLWMSQVSAPWHRGLELSCGARQSGWECVQRSVEVQTLERLDTVNSFHCENRASNCGPSRTEILRAEGVAKRLLNRGTGGPKCVRAARGRLHRFIGLQLRDESFGFQMPTVAMFLARCSVTDDQPAQQLLLKANSCNVHCATH